jgi:predicted ribosomally synthesized peptide with SipW-like signal peptide
MKKIKWIMVVLVLCLGLIGGAYAAWSETGVISGRVVTGKIDPSFDNLRSPTVDFYSSDFLAMRSDSDRLTADSVATDIRIAPGGKQLFFKVDNAFPGLSVGVQFDVINDGTAPVKLEDVIILRADGARVNHEGGVVKLDTHELYIQVVGSGGTGVLLDTVIPAGGAVTFEIKVNTLENADQNTTYDYELELVWSIAHYFD